MAFTMACFPPTEMITSEGPYSRPYLFLRRWQTASRSSGRPGVTEYLVHPCSVASMPAFLMWAGVSKSGSPTAKDTTSLPCRSISL